MKQQKTNLNTINKNKPKKQNNDKTKVNKK